jgi:hypothetical protein
MVMSIAAGTAVGWVRMGLMVGFKPWGDAE